MLDYEVKETDLSCLASVNHGYQSITGQSSKLVFYSGGKFRLTGLEK